MRKELRKKGTYFISMEGVKEEVMQTRVNGDRGNRGFILVDSRNCSEQESQALGSLMPPKKQRQGPKSNHHCRVGHEMMMKIISLVK